LEEDDDPMDDVEVPSDQDELLEEPLVAHVHDNYPRLWPPQDFCERMAEHATRPGICRQAPLFDEAKLAYASVLEALQGKSRGKASGYYQPLHDPFVRKLLEGIHSMLHFYINLSSAMYAKWGDSASMAALGLGHGKHCARVLSQLACQYILDRKALPVNPYSEWNKSMLADEDLADDIRLHLQSLGKEITVDKLVAYLDDPEVCRKHGINKKISERTAHRYLNELGYQCVVKPN